MDQSKLKVVLTQSEDGHYIVNGTLLKGKFLPEIGKSTVRYVGSDRYAQKIIEVASDYSYFRMDSGELAVLVTRKNSRRYGEYVSGSIVNGKPKPGSTPYITCMNSDTFHIVDYEAKTYYDPSF